MPAGLTRHSKIQLILSAQNFYTGGDVYRLAVCDDACSPEDRDDNEVESFLRPLSPAYCPGPNPASGRALPRKLPGRCPAKQSLH